MLSGETPQPTNLGSEINFHFLSPTVTQNGETLLSRPLRCQVLRRILRWHKLCHARAVDRNDFLSSGPTQRIAQTIQVSDSNYDANFAL